MGVCLFLDNCKRTEGGEAHQDARLTDTQQGTREEAQKANTRQTPDTTAGKRLEGAVSGKNTPKYKVARRERTRNQGDEEDEKGEEENERESVIE